jgi:hypothetical protein
MGLDPHYIKDVYTDYLPTIKILLRSITGIVWKTRKGIPDMAKMHGD